MDECGLLNVFECGTLPLEIWVSDGLRWLVDNYRPFFQALKWPVDLVLRNFEWALGSVPPTLMLVIFALLAWQIAGVRLMLAVVASLFFVGFLGVWAQTMTTLSVVFTSLVLCLILGIPLGIAAARSDRFYNIARPILDGMQTIPAFVYLVPIVMLFGIGNVPGVIVTIVFALPPVIRLTNLGIRQVPTDVVEAMLGLRRIRPPTALEGATAPGHAVHHGRNQPDAHDVAVDGGHRLDDCRRRTGADGASRNRPPGHGHRDRWRTGNRVARHCAGPADPIDRREQPHAKGRIVASTRTDWPCPALDRIATPLMLENPDHGPSRCDPGLTRPAGGVFIIPGGESVPRGGS